MTEPGQLDPEEIREQIRPILERHGVTRAGLFGSVVRGGETAPHDVDILVELPTTYSLMDMGGLKADLEDELDMTVDLVEYGQVHPQLRSRILSEQVAVL